MHTRTIAITAVLSLGGCASLYEPDEVFYGGQAAKSPEVSRTDLAALRREAADASIAIETGPVARQFRIVRRVAEGTYVLDANSEADAELEAFYRLILRAKAAGAEAIVEVRRTLLTDGVVQAPQAGQSGGAIDRDVEGSTSLLLDGETVENYMQGLATLSPRRLDKTFDRRRVAGKSVRFSGKAIVFTELQ